MSTPADTQSTPETLTIRMGSKERNLIERAAKASGKNSNDFVLDALRRAADDALLDQVNIVVTPEAYAEFLARLDMPPAPNVHLLKTVQTKAPWDKK
ncbi:CopG family transcriptional regulator [Duganella rhizosphaerae]|uniref:type II toxin-antitoxin system TacA family antitoxin n=1 Tax=Duganella rhizosphaerae TaxID=2885763 RepID=UPI0030EACC5C